MELTPELQETIKEKLASLPPALRQVIDDPKTRERMRAIAEKHELHLDQGVLLENEVTLVMLGLEDVKSFSGNIKRELNVTEEVANAITADVAEEVFLPLREALKEVLEAQNQEAAQQTEEAADTPRTPETPVQQTAPAQPSTASSPEPQRPSADTTTTEGLAPRQDAEQNGKMRPSDEAPNASPTGNTPPKNDPYREPIE